MNLPDTSDYRRYGSDNFTKKEKLYCFVLEDLTISLLRRTNELDYVDLMSCFIKDYIDYLSQNESLNNLTSESIIEKMYDLIIKHNRRSFTFQLAWKKIGRELGRESDLLDSINPRYIEITGLLLRVKLKQYMRISPHFELSFLSKYGIETGQSNIINETLGIKKKINPNYKVSKQYVLLVVLTILLKSFMLYVVVNPPFDAAGSTYLFMLSLIGLTFFIDVNIGSLPMYRKDDKNEKI